MEDVRATLEAAFTSSLSSDATEIAHSVRREDDIVQTLNAQLRSEVSSTFQEADAVIQTSAAAQQAQLQGVIAQLAALQSLQSQNLETQEELWKEVHE